MAGRELEGFGGNDAEGAMFNAVETLGDVTAVA